MCKGDIHCILHVECYARRFHRRMIQTRAKNATFCSILTKTERYLACVGDISTFKCYFHRTLHAECYARQFLASEEADLCEKCDNLLYFDDKLSVLTLLLEIFRRLNATAIALYAPNATYAVFSIETIPTVRKMRKFTPFRRKLRVVSNLLEIFRRLYSTSIPFYTSNAMLAVFGVERSRPVRKMRTLTRL